MEISDIEGCKSQALTSNSIELTERCLFLQGVYRYLFEENGTVRQVFVPFALSRLNQSSYMFLVQSPIEITEK